MGLGWGWGWGVGGSQRAIQSDGIEEEEGGGWWGKEVVVMNSVQKIPKRKMKILICIFCFGSCKHNS